MSTTRNDSFAGSQARVSSLAPHSFSELGARPDRNRPFRRHGFRTVVVPRPTNAEAVRAAAFLSSPEARALARLGLTREQVARMGGAR